MPQILIDDLDWAMSLWPKVWQCRFRTQLQQIADEIHAALFDEGWTTVRYEDYVSWVQSHSKNFSIISLDKLFPAGETQAHARLEITRSSSQDMTLPLVLGQLVGNVEPGMPVALVDDAAYSGSTVGLALHALHAKGITISHVFIGVAKASTGTTVSLNGVVPMSAMVVAPPCHDIVHFRDFFALLPYSGRLVPMSARQVHVFRHAGAIHQHARMLALQEAPGLRAQVIRANRDFLAYAMDELGTAELEKGIRESNGVVGWPIADSGSDTASASLSTFTASLDDCLSDDTSI